MATASETTIQPPLPRADQFDVLPALHELLSRIEHQASTEHAVALNGLPPTNDDETAYIDLPLLEPRDLPNEALSIKTKIRRTVRELEKLPDMERNVQQQEKEIQDLEARIQRQEALLKKLAEAAQAGDG